jgi:hypothetical protein
MELPNVDTRAAIALGCSDLVDLLDQMYPERAPSPQDTHADMIAACAKRELVRDLIFLREQGMNRRLR